MFGKLATLPILSWAVNIETKLKNKRVSFVR